VKCTYKCNREELAGTHCCNITYSQYVSVALATQHENSMRRIILSSVPCLVLKYFSLLPHKRHDFRNIIEYKMCALIFSTTEVFLILKRVQQDIITNIQSSSCKVPIILAIF